jgi:hypothetical protein
MTDNNTNGTNPLEEMYRDLTSQAQRQREANASLEGAAWFEATFAGWEKAPLQPLDDTVNYAIVVQYADPWTVELAAEKYWRGENDELGIETVTLNIYEPQPENENEVAAMDREHLLCVYGKEGLDGLMREAWQMGVENGHLEPDNPHLFSQGPADCFHLGREQPDLAELILGGTDLDDTEEFTPVMLADDEPANGRIEVLPIPVVDPDGEPLGASTVVVSYPKEALSDDSSEERVKALEIAQFHTKADAAHFGQEFLNFYETAYPGELSTLAEEVAQEYRLPTQWKGLCEQELDDLAAGTYILTHEREIWQPHSFKLDPCHDPQLVFS